MQMTGIPANRKKKKMKIIRETERELVPSMACCFFSPKFVLWVGWQACTRELCQIWLGIRGGSSLGFLIYFCDLLEPIF